MTFRLLPHGKREGLAPPFLYSASPVLPFEEVSIHSLLRRWLQGSGGGGCPSIIEWTRPQAGEALPASRAACLQVMPVLGMPDRSFCMLSALALVARMALPGCLRWEQDGPDSR